MFYHAEPGERGSDVNAAVGCKRSPRIGAVDPSQTDRERDEADDTQCGKRGRAPLFEPAPKREAPRNLEYRRKNEVEDRD